ncbi:MAG: hypothetical protein GXO26_05120, partial [Crenarchaeota archaeon]|nr:hypothetical protein [Thermoproteota archaeon]
MESLRVLLLTVGLAIVITVVVSALFHAYAENSIHGQALSIVEEVYTAVSNIGTTIIYTGYPICVTYGS